MELRRSELAFCLTPEIGYEIIQEAWEIIGYLATLDWILKLRNRFGRNEDKLLKKLLGPLDSPIPASIGINKWRSVNGHQHYNRGNDPLPPFNDLGLHALPAVLADRIVERPANEAFMISETALIIGGSRISPEFMSKLTGENSGLPFIFRNRDEIEYDFYGPDQHIVEALHRGFRNPIDKQIYHKKLNIGRYVVDSDNPDRPPLGPFVNENGICSDVLIFTLLPKLSGGRTIIANAAYGCASRLAEVFYESNVHEIMMTKLGKRNGDDAVQAVFKVPQNCDETYATDIRDEKSGELTTIRVAIEEYGTPDLSEPDLDIRIVKNWGSRFGYDIMSSLRRAFL